MVHCAIRNLPICFSINPERRPCRLRIARPTHGMRLAVRLRSCLKLNATQPVPSRHVSHALHLSHFSRKRPALLQGCRIPGIQCGRPVLRTCKIQPHIWRTSGSFFSHCRNFGTLNRASPENALFPRRHTLQDKAFQTFRKENCFWEHYYDFESKNR